ncbi:hypothetical protein OG897_35520 [Streptomyces sp. NBC_00237]|uniref:hypothetical protein n=1 Tax=Streptomyces sp. NBC_00237 TaxID=2975687 RepID=UPI00224D6560|nr:hypothetical protein [Streptomyces sp. NBC_00237]MCX5206701.1 hypothetical protein [Streptomyces sp. NBC_00237]
MNAVTAVAALRAAYGPDEEQGAAVYGDVLDALAAADLHPYIETRGGLAVCALAEDGTVVVVASNGALPWSRSPLPGWHVSHVPEDEVRPPWRCLVLDTLLADVCCEPPGTLDLTLVTEAVRAHVACCPYAQRARTW